MLIHVTKETKEVYIEKCKYCEKWGCASQSPDFVQTSFTGSVKNAFLLNKEKYPSAKEDYVLFWHDIPGSPHLSRIDCWTGTGARGSGWVAINSHASFRELAQSLHRKLQLSGISSTCQKLFCL